MTQHADGDAREPAWHAMPAAVTLDAFASTMESGLSTEDARQRLERHGANALPPAPRRSMFRRLLAQFDNVLIHVLLAAAGVTAVLGHALDCAVIVGVVLINAVIGFVQEGKAEDALDAIRNMLSPRAQVMRGGRRLELDATQLVPGDIVFIASGDRVPADLRLLRTRGLRIDESSLTGESLAVDKAPAPNAADTPLGERSAMAWSGTLVSAGQGTGVVVGTGGATQIGHIGRLLADVDALATPLTRKMTAFGRWLSWAILALAALAFVFGTRVRGYAAADMFLSAVGLAVAAIPEGLPAIMTVALAIGVQRMAARRAIIRRLPVVEALGAVTVICSDKTGTLTRNEMTVQRIFTASGDFAVTGAGYAPEGSFSLDGRTCELPAHPELTEIGRVALLCNEAALHDDGDGRWTLTGDPTEGALLTLGLKAGLDPAFERNALPRLDSIPFESEHRYMATLHHDHRGRAFVLLKGAPERLLDLCPVERHDGDARLLASARWHDGMQALAGDGMRLLAVAIKPLESMQSVLTFDDIDAGGFTLLAVLGLSDPPRAEAVEAVARCRSAGIRVCMITGDHAATARAIGERLALAPLPLKVLTGSDVERMDDAALRDAVADTAIFARASPEHKLRLVKALQARGEIVAMTGDGVNDAPALKRADVGVAMGDKGTEAAKEAAAVVLADDNFASIAAAVEEGRTVYDNIRKAIVYILPTGGGEAGIVLLAIVLGLTMPITPVQILWVNMVTAVTLSLALAFERPEADVMRRPPRDPREPLLTGFLIWRIAFVSALMVLGGLLLFLRVTGNGGSVELARTVVVNALVVGEIVYLFNVRHLTASVLSLEGATGNRYVLAAIAALLVIQALFNYLPAANLLFGTVGLAPSDWGPILLFGATLMGLVEAEKWLVRHWLARRRAQMPPSRNAGA
jgi:magnesium-transporting ATPase (P-type)